MVARIVPPLLLLAACSAPPHIAPPPPPSPPVVLAPPKPVPSDWRDMAETPGTWRYARDEAGSTARLGPPGAGVALELRCRLSARMIEIVAPGTAPALTIVTSYAPRTFPAVAGADGRIVVTIPVRDPFLDKIAFSRGRFEVVVAGRPPLILPAWAEPARVIEDCRG